MIPPKRFDIFPPDWGMLRRSRCVQICLKKIRDNLINGLTRDGRTFVSRDQSRANGNREYFLIDLIELSHGTFNMPTSYQYWVWEREAHNAQRVENDYIVSTQNSTSRSTRERNS